MTRSGVKDHDVDVLGRETARMLPGGGWLQSKHDAMGRVVQRRAGSTAAEAWGKMGESEWLGARPEKLTVDVGYSYDEAGELIEAVDKARGRTRYAYDPVGQLLSMVPEKARAELFRYDPAGNLLRERRGRFGAGVWTGEQAPAQRGYGIWLGWGRAPDREEEAGCCGGRGKEVWWYAWNGAGHLRQATLT